MLAMGTNDTATADTPGGFFLRRNMARLVRDDRRAFAYELLERRETVRRALVDYLQQHLTDGGMPGDLFQRVQIQCESHDSCCSFRAGRTTAITDCRYAGTVQFLQKRSQLVPRRAAESL